MAKNTAWILGKCEQREREREKERERNRKRWGGGDKLERDLAAAVRSEQEVWQKVGEHATDPWEV